MLGQSGEESGRLPSCPANNEQQQEKRKVCQRTRFSPGRELRMKAKEKIKKRTRKGDPPPLPRLNELLRDLMS